MYALCMLGNRLILHKTRSSHALIMTVYIVHAGSDTELMPYTLTLVSDFVVTEFCLELPFPNSVNTLKLDSATLSSLLTAVHC